MNDLPLLKFESVVEAYQWADELASRPDCVSPLGKLVGGKKGGKWRRQDFIDLALSMVGAVATVEDRLGREVFRHIASIESSRAPTLASTLAIELEKTALAKGKTYSQLVKLAAATFFVLKTQHHWKKPAGLTWYAKWLGIKRQSLDSANWRELIRLSEDIAKAWFDRGCRRAADKLEDLCVIGATPVRAPVPAAEGAEQDS